MRLQILFVLLTGALLFLVGCDEQGGGGGGFIPQGTILAVAERGGEEETIKVGGTEQSVPPGSTVEVTNLSTLETKTTTGLSDGSFDPSFSGDTDDLFNVLVTQGENIVEDVVVGVTLLSDSVQQNLRTLGSVPADIMIRGNRGYVLNGFSNNIQILDLNQNPPTVTGTITLPENSNPIAMAFLDDTRAYVANNIGQSVAVVNLFTRVCETLIVRAGTGNDPSPCQDVITIAGTPFEEPAGIAITNGKVYVSNNNLGDSFNPMGNGFITVINASNNLIIKTISTSGANTTSMAVVNGSLYALNNGNVFFNPASGFQCDFGFPPSIDLINTQTDVVASTINIPLSLANPTICLPSSITPTEDGRFAYTGLGLVGGLLKIDLFLGTVVNGTDDPIFITDPETFNSTSDIAIRNGLLFTTLFNSDQIAVVDTTNDQVNPFPYFVPFPSGIRADDPNSILFDGVQSLAVRDGVPGVDFIGPNLFYITGISEQLGSVDTTLGIPQ